MPTDYRNLSDDALAELDALLVAGEHARWQRFYADRAKPCPFFGLLPDESLAEWVRKGLVKPGPALDLGCGNGRNAIFLARHGFDVDAVDYSETAVAWAREAVAEAGAAVRLHCRSVFGYDEAALRAIWSEGLCIESLRRMHEQPAGSACFGLGYLWVMLARKAG